jgi:Glycosyl transferases, related to UDP-glucuronosyltransferase
VCIVAYVSGHGFGHSAREVEILRRLPADIPLVVKSAAPEWFWRQEVSRPFTFVADSFDVGCLQTTSLEVDVRATLAAWQAINARNRERAAAEADDLRQRGARVVLTDVPPFPLSLAADLGIPGVCVANFTWADIYAEYAPAEPAFGPVVAQLEREYARATLLLEADLALPMPYFPRRESAGLVARVGRDRRTDLEARLPEAARGKRLALLYAGNWGIPLPYARLADFSDWHFLTLNAVPAGASLPNLTVAAQDWMPHPDLVASVDLVITKPGYGMVGECLTAGTPLLYCPRAGFAEYAALDAALTAAGLGLRIPAGAFLRADWSDALASVPPRGSLPRRDAPGGAAVVARLTDLYRA